MLIDRINEIKHRITFVGDVDRLKREAEKFNTVAAEFRAITDDLAALSSTVSLLIEKDVAVPDTIASEAARHRTAFQQLKQSYDSEPETVLMASRTPRQNLKRWVEQQNEAVRTCWADHVAAFEPDISDELTRIFVKIPTFASTVNKLRRLQGEIASLKRVLPKSGVDFERAEALGRELDEAAQSLEGEGIPPRVLTFLRKIAAGDARLELLDEEVLHWLRDRGLLREFQVRPASGP